MENEMNITEQQQAVQRLKATWQFLFNDLGFNAEPVPRQYLVWLNLYGEANIEKGFERANVWVSKQQTQGRRVNLDDLVRYASACARNFKEEAENVDTQSATQ
jgi:hypothetical protein